MFDRLEMAPSDPILGLEEAFKRDPNPAKVNLAVGVYRDDSGITPIFHSVKRAETFILNNETTKTYLGIAGTAEYAAGVQGLVFGADHEIVRNHLAVTAHAPGGTGALRVAADLIKKANPGATAWISQPSWPNHANVFRAAGLAIQTYPYFDPATNGLNFDRMLATLQTVPAGDVVLLHGCCHNPTGVDLTPEQWGQVADVVYSRGLLPLVDFAYQGLAAGLHQDTAGLLRLVRPGAEMLVASSFSKNFGLYNERVGALTLVSATPEDAQRSLSQIKTCIRANYSNPPAHGAAIVSTILGSSELRAQWEGEVESMCGRIHEMRSCFVKGLAEAGAGRDFSFIERQNGMFSFTGLTKEQVRRLREEHAIYIVDSGRVNVAGLSEANLPTVCRAIAAVL